MRSPVPKQDKQTIVLAFREASDALLICELVYKSIVHRSLSVKSKSERDKSNLRILFHRQESGFCAQYLGVCITATMNSVHVD